MSQYNKVVLVKEAENTINIVANLNSDFIKTGCVFKMLEINFGNSVNTFNNLKCPKNFLLNLPSQAVVEFSEIVLVEKEFTFFVHLTKIVKVVQLDNLKVLGSVTQHYRQR